VIDVLGIEARIRENSVNFDPLFLHLFTNAICHKFGTVIVPRSRSIDAAKTLIFPLKDILAVRSERGI
jgi:hypothetical protein